MTSMRSLQALPLKQALALAMAEKARRVRLKNQHLNAVAGLVAPEFVNAPSLVLNKNHVFSDLYYKKARYKVYWGGRGAAKSWAIAEALIRMTAAYPLRILCCREFQNSIKDSSHKILKDTIERLGMQAWFTVTNETIKSRSGAEFMFKGMHNNDQGIRSTEGVDICWMEEAQTATEASWRSLIPTIRKDGSEIWVSFNLMMESDATYQRLVVKERRNSIVHKVNFDSNPYFGGVLKEEMEEDKLNDYQLYEHVWLGMPLKRSDAIIFNNKYRVEVFDDELWRQADRLYYGADFGFANDPNTLMRAFVLEGRKSPNGKRTLYVSHAQFGHHVDLLDMPALYDLVPGSRDWPIKADAARPETISHMRRVGFNMSAAEKWQGCVEDGITHLRGFDQIVIHERCKEFAHEAFMYRYKVDPRIVDEHGQPQVLPIIVDKFNHGWDGLRYSLDGLIMRSGELGMWERLGRNQANG